MEFVCNFLTMRTSLHKCHIAFALIYILWSTENSAMAYQLKTTVLEKEKYDQWIHEKFSRLKKITPSAARLFVCSKCDKATNGEEKVQQEVMCDEVETVKRFC